MFTVEESWHILNVILICGAFDKKTFCCWKTFVMAQLSIFLGPRGPLGTPSSVRPFVGAKNLDQLYSSLNQQRTTANLSDIIGYVSGGV